MIRQSWYIVSVVISIIVVQSCINSSHSSQVSIALRSFLPALEGRACQSVVREKASYKDRQFCKQKQYEQLAEDVWVEGESDLDEDESLHSLEETLEKFVVRLGDDDVITTLYEIHKEYTQHRVQVVFEDFVRDYVMQHVKLEGIDLPVVEPSVCPAIQVVLAVQECTQDFGQQLELVRQRVFQADSPQYSIKSARQYADIKLDADQSVCSAKQVADEQAKLVEEPKKDRNDDRKGAKELKSGYRASKKVIAATTTAAALSMVDPTYVRYAGYALAGAGAAKVAQKSKRAYQRVKMTGARMMTLRGALMLCTRPVPLVAIGTAVAVVMFRSEGDSKDSVDSGSES